MTHLKLIAVTALFIFLGWALHPFANGIVWSVVLASVSWPLAIRVSNRHRGRLAASLTLGVMLLMIIPMGLLIYEAIQAGELLLPWYQNEAAHGWPAPDILKANAWLLSVWQKGSSLLPATVGSHVQSWVPIILGRTEELLINALVALLLLWTFVRSGTSLTQKAEKLTLNWFGQSAWEGMVRATITLRATFLGIAMTATGETFLFIALFMLAGLPHAISFGALAGVLSVIPGLTPVVFVAAAVWLAVQHSMIAAIAVTVSGTLIVGVADHFVKPVFIGRATGLPMAITLLSMLAGLLALGVAGLFLGPAVAAGTAKLLDLA